MKITDSAFYYLKIDTKFIDLLCIHQKTIKHVVDNFCETDFLSRRYSVSDHSNSFYRFTFLFHFYLLSKNFFMKLCIFLEEGIISSFSIVTGKLCLRVCEFDVFYFFSFA